MSLQKSKYKKVGIAAVGIFLITLLYVILQYENGAISKSNATYVASIGLLPALFFVVIYSLKMGETFAKGITITKKENPDMYGLTTAFWCVFLLIDIIYVLYRTLN